MDAWFCGYVPQLATCVWVGYPKAEIPLLRHRGLERGVRRLAAGDDLEPLHVGGSEDAAGPGLRLSAVHGSHDLIAVLVHPVVHPDHDCDDDDDGRDDDCAACSHAHATARQRRLRPRRAAAVDPPPPETPPTTTTTASPRSRRRGLDVAVQPPRCSDRLRARALVSRASPAPAGPARSRASVRSSAGGLGGDRRVRAEGGIAGRVPRRRRRGVAAHGRRRDRSASRTSTLRVVLHADVSHG